MPELAKPLPRPLDDPLSRTHMMLVLGTVAVSGDADVGRIGAGVPTVGD